MKNNIKAEIVAHSKRAETGEEIITYKLTFPRIILSEVNTYKQIEKNTSSCLTGDTLITLYDEKSRRFFDMEIRKVFRDFINDNIDYKIVSFLEDGSNAGCFIVQDIKTIFSSGVKDIYKVEQNNIYAPLKVTDKHRLLTDKGWKTIEDYKSSDSDEIKIKDNLLALTCNEALYNLKKVENNIVSTKFLEDRFRLLDEISVVSVKHIGKDETYDIEVNGDYHNFIANGVVVHNSRAIPFEKMVEVVEKEPFIPIAWQLSHKGMQGKEYITNPYVIEKKIEKWLKARDRAVESAMELSEEESPSPYCKDVGNSSVSKQLSNRILEPWMWVTQLCTGTRESFEHLFNQRCPIYNVEGLKFTSKKEAIELYPHLKDMTDLEWLQCNSGQAEIHFMDLAEKMYDALNESISDELKDGNWHIPFQEEIWKGKQAEKLEDFIKMSVCLTAKISYTKIGDENTITIEKAREMYEKLKNSGHWSCFGHIAKCMTYEEYENWYKGFMKTTYYFDENGRQHRVMDSGDFHKVKGYNKNLRGFISLRQYVEDGEILK